MIDTMSNHRGTYPCWDYVRTMWKLSSLPMISWIDHIDPWDVWSVGRLSVMISADMTLFERMSCGSEISNTSMVKQLTLHVTDPSSTFLNSSKNTFIFWAIIVILGRYTISCDMIGERRVGWNCCSGVAHFVLPLCVKEFILKTVSYFLEKVLPSVPLEKHVDHVEMRYGKVWTSEQAEWGHQTDELQTSLWMQRMSSHQNLHFPHVCYLLRGAEVDLE